eukprot:6522635-Prymnesium_polylepis.1
MLFADAGSKCFVHHLQGGLGEPASTGRSWPSVEPALRASARKALTRVAKDDAELLVLFDRHVPRTTSDGAGSSACRTRAAVPCPCTRA